MGHMQITSHNSNESFAVEVNNVYIKMNIIIYSVSVRNLRHFQQFYFSLIVQSALLPVTYV